jgi:hypothetical protein
MPTIVDNCRLELEDRAFLAELREIPQAFKTFARPDSVGVEWHKDENQGRLGSCQGNDLSSCVERVEFVAEKPAVQLSRIFAYLATQKLDGLLGSDRGSTISGGAKLAKNSGVCPEALTGYPGSYPGSSARSQILSAANYEAAGAHKVTSLWNAPEDPDEARNWIGGGGAISLGIVWPGIPSDRIIKKFSGGSGGHAVAILGYDPTYLVAVNSWGDGPFKITNDAWRSMMRHSYTAAIGLAGDEEPQPKPVRIHLDW